MTHPSAHLTPRRRRTREAKTERILAAAMAILVEEGASALTIGRLAEGLDYTVGALYRYFSSKDALLAELERRVVERIGELVAQADARVRERGRRLQAPTLALARLVSLARVYQSLPEQDPERFALVSQNLADPRRLVAEADDLRVMESLGPLLHQVAGLFEGAEEAGALEKGDAGVRAMVLWSGLHGSVQLRKLDRLAARFALGDALTPSVVRTLLLGWGAERRALGAAERLVDGLDALLLNPDAPA